MKKNSKNEEELDTPEKYKMRISNASLIKMKRNLINKLPMTPFIDTPAKFRLKKSQTAHKLESIFHIPKSLQNINNKFSQLSTQITNSNQREASN